MKKNSLGKMIITGLVLTLLVVPVSAFAEEPSNGQEIRQEKEVKNPFRGGREDVDYKQIRLEQVATYTPESYDTWVLLFENAETLKAERDTLKAELKVLIEEVWKPFMEEKKAGARAEVQVFTEDLKAKVESGEITREEAADLFDEYITDKRAEFEEMKELREAAKEDREAEREYYKELHEDKRSINKEIKEAVESGNLEAVPALLNSILEINLELEAHALETLDMMQTRIDEILSL